MPQGGVWEKGVYWELLRGEGGLGVRYTKKVCIVTFHV